MTDSIINIAMNAALSAGKIIIRSLDRLDTIKVIEKKPNDYVTEIDQAVEREIIKVIRKAYPKHGILAEESGESPGEEYQWIIDPIDGTRNFIHGFPHFAISIGVRYRNKIEYGVIYDPIRDELFSAVRGKGARLNDRKIRVSGCKSLKNSLIGTGFAHRHKTEYPEAFNQIAANLLPACGDIRRAGAATLDLAYVACGRLDGFWEMGLQIWDMAAGSLLVKEAGGLVTDPQGGDDYFTSGNIVVGTPNILKLMLKEMKPFVG